MNTENDPHQGWFEPSPFATPEASPHGTPLPQPIPLLPAAASPFYTGVPFPVHPTTPEPSVFRTPELPQRLRRTASESALLDRAPHTGRMYPPESPASPTPRARTASNPQPQHRTRRPRLTPNEKLQSALKYLREDLNWSASEFMHQFFHLKDDEGNDIHRSQAHGLAVWQFLSGQVKYKPVDILESWLKDPAGRPSAQSEEAGLGYSSTVPYREMKCARPALTSMAVQLVMDKLQAERNVTVRGVSGLHGTGNGKRGHRTLVWQDIGAETVNEVKKIIQTLQPLTFELVLDLATPRSRPSNNGVVAVRKTRPPEVVATEVISTLNFSHTQHARRLPAGRAILFFATQAPRILFDYGSRIGFTQSWSTTYVTLRQMAEKATAALQEAGRDDGRWLFMRTDNVQHQYSPGEYRIGREKIVMVGLAAYVAEADDFEPQAADLDDHLLRIAENRRKDLSIPQLLGWLDPEHLQQVGILQWVQTLVDYIPSLARYKGKIAECYRTTNAKLRVSLRKTRIHSLSTVARNETVYTDLKAAIFDFLSQFGQSAESYKRRLIPVGGDGLTFEKILKLKQLLMFHSDDLESLRLLYPFLETFHTHWTHLSLLYETHWGSSLTKDPSRLGHCATKINQKPPLNLKKVDYYPGKYLAYLVLDARMLDCWRIEFEPEFVAPQMTLLEYFKQLDMTDKTPTFDDLLVHASRLYHRYSRRYAYYQVLSGCREGTTGDIPVRSPWISPDEETMPHEHGEEAVSGDACLADSIMYMSDMILSREVDQAIAEGDVGRVYEGLKAMFFNFASSGHTKYPTYLLEMFCMLELESSPALRDCFLRNWLVNPSGKPGHFQSGDLLEEHLNKELQRAMSRKDMTWDGNFMRNVVSPNIHHLMEVRKTWGEGVSLATRRGEHPEPHSNPELRILLRELQCEEQHRFRKGRTYGHHKDIDTFAKGFRAWDGGGKLKRWVEDGQRVRAVAAMLSDPEIAAVINAIIDDMAFDLEDGEEREVDDAIDDLEVFHNEESGGFELSNADIQNAEDELESEEGDEGEIAYDD